MFDLPQLDPAQKFLSSSLLKTDSVKGNIVFENVSFSYPSRHSFKVLNNFSLTIKEGTSLALVGQSGGGKTTATKLLLKFYDPTEGEVRLDGISLKQIDGKELRRFVTKKDSFFLISLLSFSIDQYSFSF